MALPRAANLVELIAERVTATPTAIALDDGARQLSYQQLFAAAGGVAARLQDLGVGPDSVVALAMPRSIEMLVGVLAVLRRRRVNPVNADDPPQRIGYVLDNSARVVLPEQQPN